MLSVLALVLSGTEKSTYRHATFDPNCPSISVDADDGAAVALRSCFGGLGLAPGGKKTLLHLLFTLCVCTGNEEGEGKLDGG